MSDLNESKGQDQVDDLWGAAMEEQAAGKSGLQGKAVGFDELMDAQQYEPGWQADSYQNDKDYQ